MQLIVLFIEAARSLLEAERLTDPRAGAGAEPQQSVIAVGHDLEQHSILRGRGCSSVSAIVSRQHSRHRIGV
jgi:hypothetical protein